MIIIIIFNEGLDQYMKKQEIQNIGLDTLPVLFTDTSLNSSNYFNVIDIPQRFTAGKNIIKLLGNQTNLEPSAPVYIEILDANKKPIYHEVLDYQDDDGTVCIRINITDDVVPGNCELYIVTRATNIPELQLYNIPAGGVSNIKWNRQISVSPTSLNSNDILFVSGSLPKVDITEKITPYFAQTYKQNRLNTITGSSTVRLQTPGSRKKSTPSNLTTTGQNRIGNTFLYKVIQPNPDITDNRKSAIAASPIVIQNNTMPTLQITSGNFVFSSSMVGGTITINNPIIETESGNVAASTTYTSTIVKVINQTSAYVADELSFTYNDTLIHGFADSQFTCSYIDTPVLVQTENFQSYININMYNIAPEGGSVHKIRTYMKPVGASGEYRLINETVLTQQDILIDTGSLSGENKIGEFESISDITTYWSSSVANLIPMYDLNYKALGTNLQVSYNRSILNDSIQLDSLTAYTEGDFAILKLRDTYFQNFYKNDTYVISLDASVKSDSIFKTTKIPSTLRDAPDGWIDVYVSGSAFNPNPSLDTDSIQTKLIGKYIGSIYLNDGAILFDNVHSFEADNDGTGTLLFAIRSGNWNLSNIHIYPDASLGYNPSRILLRLPVPTISINAEQQFKFQYFDYQGNPADYETEVFGPVFTGGNTYIEGDQNVLTGSLSVGGGIGKGLDIVGDLNYAWSGIHGYTGFDNAVSGSGSPGVAIWSGSTTIGSTTYAGTGFELASNAYYLRFTGNASSSGSLSIKAGSITVDNLTVSGGISLTGFTSSYWTGSSDGSIKRVSNVVITGSTYISGALSIGDRIAVASASRDINLLGTNAVIRVVRVDPTLANSPSIEFMPKPHIDSASAGYWDVSVRHNDGSFRIRDRAIGTTADRFILSGSLATVSASMIVTGSVTAPAFTGSLFGTSSWAVSSSQAVSSSYSLSSSFAVSASYALSSSYSLSSSFAISSSRTVSASRADSAVTASYVLNAISSSFAATASYVNQLNQDVVISGSAIVTGSINVSGSVTFASSSTGTIWSINTDGASIKFYNTGDGDTDSRLEFQTLDNNNEYFRWTHNSAGNTYESLRLVPNGTNNSTMTLSGSMITTGNIGIGMPASPAKVNISASGAEAELLRFETERSWRFLQSGSGPAASLELNCLANNKTFKITTLNRSSSFEVNTADTDTDKVIRMLPDANDGYVTIGHRSAQSGMIFDVSGSSRLRGSLNVGVNTTASGLYSYAGGNGVSVASYYSFIHANSSSISAGASSSAILAGTNNRIYDSGNPAPIGSPATTSNKSLNSAIIAGQNNSIYGHDNSAIIAGSFNQIHEFYQSSGHEAIIGSYSSSIYGSETSVIAAGYGNSISASNNTTIYRSLGSFTGGGWGNSIVFSSFGDTILGGKDNQIKGVDDDTGYSFDNGILGGTSNIITSSLYSTILGGYGNNIGPDATRVSIITSYLSTISGSSNSSIIGGSNNLIKANLDSVTIIGCNNVTGSTSNTVYVPNLYATGSITYPNVPSIAGVNTALYVTPAGVITNNSSDGRRKTNITTIDSALDTVKQLRGVYFNWSGSDDDSPRSIGFIAHEVAAVAPELAFTNEHIPEKWMGVHYAETTALLVEAVKTLAAENESLKSELQTIKTHLGL